MNSLSRVVSLLTATVLASTVLAGCGDDEDKGKRSDHDLAAAAGVQACRAFALDGGAGGESLVQDLRAIAQEGSYNPVSLLAAIRAVKASAAEAGKVTDLSQDDFKLFRAVVDATATAEGDALGVTDSRSLDTQTTQALNAALGAVKERCA